MTHESVLGYDTVCKVNPPLREEEDVEALREALRDGTIDCIATDHAPHTSLEKDCEFAAASHGIIGVETALPAMLELVRRGIFTPLRLIEALSTAPVKITRLEGGSLVVGARADITVIDPEARWTVTKDALRSKSHNTPLLGREVQGRVRLTLVGGQMAHEIS